MVLAWENLRRFLWCCLHFVAVAVLHLWFFFIRILVSTSTFTFRWTIARFLEPFFTFSPAHSRMIRGTFIFQPFRDLLTESATTLSGYFSPTGVFYLIPITNILAQAAFVKVSLGPGSYFLESCRVSYWSSKHRPGPSVCLIHSNPQSFLHLKSVFMHVNIAKVLLVVKTLIRSAATLFTSHENIKQLN